MTQDTTTKPVNQKLRRAILGTAAGVTAVGVWQKPMIKSVILPAHAQTSVSDSDGSPPTDSPPADSPLLRFTITGDPAILVGDDGGGGDNQGPPSVFEKLQLADMENSKAQSVKNSLLDLVIPSAQAQDSTEDEFVTFYVGEIETGGGFEVQLLWNATILGCMNEALYTANLLFEVGSAATMNREICTGASFGAEFVFPEFIQIQLISVELDGGGMPISAKIMVNGAMNMLGFDDGAEPLVLRDCDCEVGE